MFQPSVNQISSAYLGNPGALQSKVQQEQKGRPDIPPDLRDLLALQDIQNQKDAYARQMAMTPPQPTVAEKLIQAVKQPLSQPGQQAMPQAIAQGMPPGMPQQGMPQGLPQGLPQEMSPSMPPAPQPGLQQLPSNIGQHMSGGGIVAFAGGEDVERDQLRRIEAAYDPAVTEEFNKANTTTDYMPAEVLAAARQGLARGVMLNPEQERAAEERRYQAQVGNRDTSQYDRLIAEYENRKKQLEGPKPGIDALMEYLGMVAATPRGRSWTEAGSSAARSQNALQQERQSQQFELTKQAIEAAQKKNDLLFGEKKELFGIGNSAYDRAFKTNFDAAKLVTSNDMDAQKMAKQVTDNQLERENRLKVAGINASTHGAPTYSDRQKEALLSEWMKANPGKSRLEAATAVATALQGATPELKRAQLTGGYIKEYNDLTEIQKMGYEKRGISTPQQYAQMMTELVEGKTPSAALPLPSSQDALVKNQVYQTAKGAAKWDGSQFIPATK